MRTRIYSRALVAVLALAVFVTAGCTMPAMPSMPNVQMPDVQMPNVQMPDLSGVDLSSVAALLPNVERAPEGGVNVRVQAAPVRIVLAAASAALTVAADEYLGLPMDPLALLNSVAGVNVVDIPRSISAAELARLRAAGVAGREAIAALDAAQAAGGAALQAQSGEPPAGVPVLMVISKENSESLFWQLSENVQSIQLGADQPGVEMKVYNEQPLRIELWVDADVETVDVVVDYAE